MVRYIYRGIHSGHRIGGKRPKRGELCGRRPRPEVQAMQGLVAFQKTLRSGPSSKWLHGFITAVALYTLALTPPRLSAVGLNVDQPNRICRLKGVPQCDARMISHTLHRLHSLVLNVHLRRQSVACQPSTSVEFQSQVLAEVHYGKRTEVVEFMYATYI